MKEQFHLRYDYMDQADDVELSKATMAEILKSDQEKQAICACHDFDLWDRLLQQRNQNNNSDDETVLIQLHSITLFHTSVCVMGLQAEYRVHTTTTTTTTTTRTSTTTAILHKGKMHYFGKGDYIFPSCSSTTTTTTDLDIDSKSMIRLRVTRKESLIKVRPERNGAKGKAVTVSYSMPFLTMTIP